MKKDTNASAALSPAMNKRASDKIKNAVPQKVLKEYHHLQSEQSDKNLVLALTDDQQHIIIGSITIGSIAKRIQNRQFLTKKLCT